MDDTVAPSRLGIQDIFGQLLHDSIKRDDAGSVRALLFLSGKATILGRELGTEFADLFEIYLRLFSGYGRTTKYIAETKSKVSAVTEGGLYCYVDFIRDPCQSYGQASRVHVGRGTIQLNNRTYPTVLDQDADQVLWLCLPTSLSESINQSWKALVNEHITLRFWYESATQRGESRVWLMNPMASLGQGWGLETPNDT